MMYCDNCGAKVADGKIFCDNCGSKVGKVKMSDYLKLKKNASSTGEHIPYQPTPPAMEHKSPIIAVILATIIFPGVGQIYVNKALRGFGYLAGFIAILFLAIVASNRSWASVTLGLFILLSLYYLWIHIDAVLLVRRYNKFLDKNLRKPKSKEKW